MLIEVCDICKRPVNTINKTEVIIQDFKGMTFELDGVFPAKRKFKGVICNKCLDLLRDSNSEKKEE
jgi:hypothetical protein